MPQLDLDDGCALHFTYAPPRTGAPTFVFYNALTGDAGMWEPVAETLRSRGEGTLTWNYRGQKGSLLASGAVIDAARIEDDARTLLEAVAPPDPVHVGLSIGGLFALRGHLGGAPARAFLLINTLRRDGPRLRWLNDALYRCARTGGLRLVRDLYAPLLFGAAWQEQNRAQFLTDEPYAPLPAEDPDARLLAASATADWDIPYERIETPVAVMTGLQDRLFREPADIDALSARLIRAERIDVPEAGHMIPVEAPDAVIRACLALAEGLR